jgi:hypothetical protein
MHKLARACAQHSVVFVYGRGGMGKSVLGLRHLLSLSAGPVGLSLRAMDAQETVLLSELKLLRSPRNYQLLPHDCLDQAIGRLKVANENVHLVLAIDIDALDEASPLCHGELSRLIRKWFDCGKGIGSNLVISCRPRQHSRNVEHALIRDWLGNENPDAVAQQVGFVEVDDFDDEEFDEANRLLGPNGNAPINAESQWATLADRRRFPFGTDGRVQAAPSPVAGSLRHPVVWGVFASLASRDRQRILDGSADGVSILAKSFIDRFLIKCVVRRNHQIQDGHLLAALCNIARSAIALAPLFGKRDHWDSLCPPLLNQEESTFLYNEAVSYGLIDEEEPTKWRWRHEFVANWLVRTEDA